MFKKFKTIFKVVEWVAFTVLLCLIFVVISPKLPIKNVPKSFIVVSGSMEPTIKTGSVAFTKTVDPKNIKAGDIIAFTSPSDSKDTILHRVNSISSTDPLLFKTKGDHNNDIDAWDVQDVGVKGVYFFAIPYLGSLAAILRQPWGFSIVVGIPALIFIISQILNIKKAIDDEVNRKVAQKLQESSTKNEIKPKTILKSLIFFFLISFTIFGLNHLNSAKALYTDTVTINGITLSVADFTKPSVPVLNSPANGSFVNTSGLIMDWLDSDNNSTPNQTYYIYQSSHSPTFNPLTYESPQPLYQSQISAPNTPDGVYYWRVKACFATDRCSDWSEFWQVTVDSTLPTSTITKPWNSDHDHDVIFPVVWFWDGKVEGTASDNFELDHVELSIYRQIVDLYWNGKSWISGTESSVRVKADGTKNWSYQIDPMYIPLGKFKIVAHAVDKAGNVENSATIEFENSANSTTSVSSVSTDPEISLFSDHTNNKINLKIDNFSKPSDYEILYTGNGVEKGLVGKITTDEITNSTYSKDFYFGICSAGGACVSDDVQSGSKITVNLSGGYSITKTFTY